MSALPKCPVCCEGELRPIGFASPEDGEWRYRVECLTCDVELGRKDLRSYNDVMKFIDDAGRGPCRDVGGDGAFRCSRCGYSRRYTRDELASLGAFSYCPTCGAEVLR